MSGQAVFGGALIFACVLLWHCPTPQGVSNFAKGATCQTARVGTFCAAIAGLSKVRHDPLAPFKRAGRLPPRQTPGAIDPAITQANIDTTICRPGYARSVRPPYSITAPIKRQLMQAEHAGEAMADYELDHLIPISIGGAPLDRRDLWLQPRRGQANAGDKNVLAYVLWRLVCEHRLPLKIAQHDISRDWTSAYQTYATPENVAKYHFRHSDGVRD